MAGDGVPPDILVGVDWTDGGRRMPVLRRGDDGVIHATPGAGGNPMAGTICSVQGHNVRLGEATLTLDGTFVAYCIKCNERITVDRLPGGMPVIEARAVAHMAVTPEVPTDKALAALTQMKHRLEQERKALIEVERQIDLAERAVVARLAKMRSG